MSGHAKLCFSTASHSKRRHRQAAVAAAPLGDDVAQPLLGMSRADICFSTAGHTTKRRSVPSTPTWCVCRLSFHWLSRQTTVPSSSPPRGRTPSSWWRRTSLDGNVERIHPRLMSSAKFCPLLPFMPNDGFVKRLSGAHLLMMTTLIASSLACRAPNPAFLLPMTLNDEIVEQPSRAHHTHGDDTHQPRVGMFVGRQTPHFYYLLPPTPNDGGGGIVKLPSRNTSS